MKKIINILLIGILASLTLMSCDKDTPSYDLGDGNGQLSLKSLAAKVVNGEVVINSRSASTVDLSNYIVTVTNKSTSTEVEKWTYSKMPEVVTLPVGDYTVAVKSGEEVEAAFDSPYFYGTQDFTIKKNDIVEVDTIKCTLHNLKVSIQYSDELKAAIGKGSDVKVNVKVGDTNSLDFAYGETRAGYFKCGTENKTLVATFSGTVDGYYISEYKILSDVAAGQHRIITFSLKETPNISDEYGTIGTTGLKLDATVTTVDMTVSVPGGEDIIDPFDFMNLSAATMTMPANASTKDLTVSASGNWTAASSETWCTLSQASGAKGTTAVNVAATENTGSTSRSAVITFTMGKIVKKVTVTQSAAGTSSGPTITSTSINLAGENIVTDGMKVDVDIAAPAGIKNLVVDIISADLTEEFLNGVGMTTHFDLCNPGSYESALNGLGLPTGSNVKGKTALKFDISSFMPMLKIYKGTHKFKITVTDANDATAEATIILKVQ